MSDLRLLRAGGTALLLDARGDGPPLVLHWGADPGPLDDEALAELALALVPDVAGSAFDEVTRPSIVPGEAEGWSGRPGLAGQRPGGGPPLRLLRTAPVEVDARPDGGCELVVGLADEEAGVRIVVQLRLEASGVLRMRQVVTATAAQGWSLAGALSLLPVPSRAADALDTTGRWCRERSPQRGPVLHGARARESRRGRTGHDAPTVLVAGTAGFGFRHGEVWGAHVAWSGDQVHVLERLPEGHTLLGGGELLRPGEVELARGQSWTSPWTVFVWSDKGLDGLSARLHTFLRARPNHPTSPRPLVLNTWEAVYFDHDLARLLALAETAAGIGVERFVLDDGWFRGRRSDSAGLGDWTVDPEVWPKGLHPLFDRVRELGMQVGLWVEPEMVNLDSDLARRHPDWLLSAAERLPLPWRRQQVLDLARTEAFAYLLERLDALVTEYRLDYLKWDHNRDLHLAAHGGRPGVHAQTHALYRLLDALRERHPGLEIESCASGGARVDLGILDRTDRVWASDTNDAVERQQIQRWTGLLLPPELVGAHVGPPRAHTTGRVVDLGMRLLTSLFGHAGIEWDVTTCSPQELDRLRAWAALYRELRPLLHSGVTVRADLADDGLLLHGVVAQDRSHAVYACVRTRTGELVDPGPLPLPGLDGGRHYRVRRRTELDDPGANGSGPTSGPPWTLRTDGVVLPGSALATPGPAAPMLRPATGILLEATDLP
ncbi:MAG TPA: alpha-galactosidase [Actinomycetales bacterium]|nr:alpha-galactosidase [Actinomycetales bacterium]